MTANRRIRLAVSAAFVATFAAMLILAFARGTWLDEVWTLWLTGHQMPIGALYRERWSFEPHMPLFYSWMWAVRGLVPTFMPLLRLSNVAGALALAGAIWIARRHGASPRYLAVFALLVLSSPVVIVYFAELRMYYLQTTLFAGLVVLLERVHASRDDLGRGQGGLAVALFGFLLLAACLHYLSAAFCFTTAGMEAFDKMRRRQWRFAALIVVGVAVAMALLLPPLAHYLSLGTLSSPMMVSPLKGYITTGGLIAVALGANLAAFCFAALGLLRARAGGEGHVLGFSLVCVLAAIVVALAFTTLNDVQNFLIPRYVLQFVPLLAAPVALLAQGWFDRPAFLLVPANAALLAAVAVVGQAHNRRWEENVPAIRRQIAACPTTQVLGMNPYRTSDLIQVPKATTSPDASLTQIIDGGYAYIAGASGFDIAGFVPAKGPPRRIAKGCPTLIWTESNYWTPTITAEDMVDRAGIARDGVATMRIDNRGDHSLATLEPTP